MRRSLAVLSVVAGLILSGCGGDGGRSPAAPSTTSLAQPSGIDAQASCPALNGDPGCFSGGDFQGLIASAAAVSAPISLHGSVNGSTVSLTWTKPSTGTPTSYQVQAGSSSGGSNLANLNTGNPNTSFTANGVGNATLFIRVLARDGSGLGPPSNEIKLVVGSGGGGGGGGGSGCTSAPNSPSNLTVSMNGSTASMKWNAPSGGCAPTSYVMQAGSSSGQSNIANTNTGNTNTALTASGVGPGTYYVRIRASNSNGVSGPSNEVKVIVSGGGGGGGGGDGLSVTKFLCFGDSMTDGGLSPTLSSGGYPTRLLSLLKNAFPSQQITVLNDAKGGEKATSGRSRLPGELDKYHPQVLCLLEGVNDLSDGHIPEGAISSMVNAARSRGIAVLLATLPPQDPSGNNPDIHTSAPLVIPFNNEIKQIAASQGATLVDIYAAFNGNLSLIGADGKHPTVAGHNKIADTFFNVIVNKFAVNTLDDTLTDDLSGWKITFDEVPPLSQP